MKYIKKEDLKEGDVFVTQLSNNHFLNKYDTGFNLHLSTDNTIKIERLYKKGGFAYNNMRLATSEEKHWLETCIIADKLIPFEEAMKSFIPEYVECIKVWTGKSKSEIKKIYKTLEEPEFSIHNWNTIYNGINITKYFKPSTKEAYDAQFVVKEPEFVLPEKWCLKITIETTLFI